MLRPSARDPTAAPAIRPLEFIASLEFIAVVAQQFQDTMSDSFDKTSGDAPPDTKTPDIDYPAMVQDALRRVVCSTLGKVAEEGLPGEHHFYISFATEHSGVGLSEALRAQHPDEMTIVLQHDFRDLDVDDDGFDVTLRFGGVPQRLRVPFEALTAFFDPSVHFMLRFEAASDDSEFGEEFDDELLDSESGEASTGPKRVPTDVIRQADASTARLRGPRPVPSSEGDAEETGAPGEVVSFEAFRRK